MKRLAERQNIIIYAISICGLLLGAKTAQLQLFSSKYKDQAERTTLNKNIKYPARGMFYDRNGKTLVANKPIYDLEVTYSKIDPEMDVSLFCSLLGITRNQYDENLNKDWSNIRFSKSVPFTFLSKIPAHKFAAFQERQYQFPGFSPVTRNVRVYPHQNAAHVLGFLSEVENEDIDNGEGVYALGDLIGEVGLEKKYEKELRGEKGIEFLLKDNFGRKVGSYEGGRLDSTAISGEDILLSLDLELQAYAEKLMQNKRGAVIALEPKTGEILSMVSAPTYNPNALSFGNERDTAYQYLASDTYDRPMINRALSAMYPPGSIFKPIFQLIALQHGIIDPYRKIYCGGAFKPTGQRCHSAPGYYSAVAAVQHSCNVYYFQLLREFVDQYDYKNPGKGLDTLVNYMNRFGIGKKIGIDYTFENPGFIPDSKYYDELHRIDAPNGWRSTYITSIGIGQGQFQFTTLQMANMAAAIANRGYYVRPHFIKAYLSGEKDIPFKYREKLNVGIDQEHFEPVIEGMRRAVTAGTSRTADIDDIEVCGKTGTSENAGNDHSVFICFAPRENPKIAIAVFVENAGWGATYAGSIAGLMVEQYLKGEIDPRRKYLEDRMLNSNLLNKNNL